MIRRGSRWSVAPILAVLVAVASCSPSGNGGSSADDVTVAPSSISVVTDVPVETVTDVRPRTDTVTPSATGSETVTPIGTGTGTDSVSESVDRSVDGVGDSDAPIMPEGFATASVEITTAQGEVCIVCTWLASDGDARSRGLMGVTDLGEPVGMAFAWDAPTSGNFFMFQTPMPLSIAWFAPSGEFVDEADMAPCVDANSSTCERFGAGGEYELAIEVVQGQLGALGIGAGATARIVDRHATCPLVDDEREP